MKEKKRFGKIAIQIFLFVTALALFVCSELIERENPVRLFLQIGSAIFFVLLAIWLSIGNGKHWTGDLFRSVRSFFERMGEAVVRFFGKTFGKQFRGNGKSADYIMGYQDIIQRVNSKRKMGKRRKRKKYRDMDNCERIRYFYELLIRRQIKRGYAFDASMTATENGQKLLAEKRIGMERAELFECYNEARYNPEVEIPDEVVEKFYKKVNDKN